MWLLSVVEMGSDQLSRQDMSVTFSNETFNNSDAAVGAIAAVNVLGLMVDEFAGSPLTGTVGLTTVTVNGTAGAPGSPASISINSPLVQIANGAATYAGFYNNAGNIVYYFNVVGTNIVTGLAATVAVAVSAEALPSLLTATPINTSATTAPLDPNLPGPVFQSASVTGNTVTLAYNEPLSGTGPLATDFTVTSGGVANTVTAATVSGNNVVLTLATPAANGQTVTVAYGDPTTGNDARAIQDVNGLDAASLPVTTITNNTPQAPGPVLQTAAVNGNTVTLVYNETLSATGPLTSSFMVSAGGVADGVTAATVSGQTVTLTLATPVANGQPVTVGYMDPGTGNDPNAVQDTVGNDAATLTPITVTNNTPQAPGPVLQTAAVNGTTVTLGYNETLSATGPVTGAYTVTVGGTVANVTAATVSGQSVILTLATPVANGQPVTVAYMDPTAGNDMNAVQDVVGNDAATTPAPLTVTNNTPQAPGPVLQTATVNGNTVTLGYNEVLGTPGPATGSYAVTVDGAVANVTAATVSGQTVVLTLATPVANGQPVTVGYTDPSAGNDAVAVQDLVGNDAATTPAALTAINDTPQAPGPVLQTATVNGNTVTLAYNETLSASGPAAGAFTVMVDGAAAPVSAATVSGQSITLTLATPVANGQAVTVGYMDPTAGNDVAAVQDTVGNDAETIVTPVAAANTTAQAPGPVLQTASVNGNTVTLGYNEALSVTGPAAGSFAVLVDGNADAVASATVSGQTVTLTLATPVANGQAVTVGYTDPTAGNDTAAVQDAVGNDAATTPVAITATNATPQAPGPVLQTATVAGNTVTLAYNEALSGTGPLASSFAVMVDGVVAPVSAATVSGQTVVLTLANPVANGQGVTVGYTDPSAANDANAVQDVVGNDAATTPVAITATNTTPQAPGPVLQTATVNGNSLALAFNETLSATAPTPGSFAVTIGGAAVGVTAVTVTGLTVTLTLDTPAANGQPVTVGYADPTSGNDVNAVQDAVGNDAGTFAATAATNITPQAPGPVLQTASVNGATVTLGYNEILSATGPAAGSYTVMVGDTVANVSAVAVAGQTVTLTLDTPAANGQAVTIGYKDPTTGNDIAAVQDNVGNDAATILGPFTATNVTPQGSGPTFVNATVDSNVVTLAYDEALGGTPPDAGAFEVTVGGVGATVTGVAVSGQSVVLTLGTAATNGQAVTVGYADPTADNDIAAIQDRVGNDANTLLPTAAVNVTPLVPGPVLQTAAVSGNVLTLAYNETLSDLGPAPGAFTVTVGGAVADVTAATVSDNTVTLTLGTPVANGQAVTVAYADPTSGNDINAVQDAAGNDASATSTPITATNNTSQAPGPVLQTATVNGNIVTLGYSEALGTPGPATGAYTVMVDGAAASVTAATVSGGIVTLTLATPVANGQPVTVGYTDPTANNDLNAAQDTVGNDAATTLTPVTAINNTAQAPGPVLQSAAVNGNTVTLAYNEVLGANGPSTDAFTVTVGGVDATVSTATVSGQTVVLTLATPVANGQPVTVGYTDPTDANDTVAVQDTAGNDAATTSAAIRATNNTPQAPGPVLQTAAVTGDLVTLTYNENLGAPAPSGTSFSVAVDGGLANVTNVAVSGQTITLTLANPVANGQAVTVGYTDPTDGNDPIAVQDTVGNDAATILTPVTAANNTPQAPGPVLQTATVTGNTVSLGYDKTLSTTGPDAGSYTVMVDGRADAVATATVSGQSVTLTLATPVTNGQPVTVAYTDPTSGNDATATQDVAGNDAATIITPVLVTNATPQAPGPVLQTAIVDGNTVTLAYNEALGTPGPATGSFAVTVGGVTAPVSTATVSGQTVVLTLATPVANGQPVTVGYTDPTAANDTIAVQDTAGNDATTTPAAIAATNTTPQAPGPVLQTATINGSTVTLAYNEALSPTGPAASAYTVTVGGVVAPVSTATVSGQTVTLALATPVANGQAVTVGYRDPSAGNDVNAVQDTVGNDAASTLTPITATNATPQAPGPVLQTATVNGSTVTLAYDEALSPVGPAADSFAVTVGGAAATVTAATVSGQSVVLTLGGPVINGQAVTVGYTDPTGGNDVVAVQDLVGNDSATFTPVAAVNTTPQSPGPVLQTANVTGSTVTLAYNEALSPVGPPAGSFAVTANGLTDTVTSATVSGQSVVLTLATPVANGQAVTVGYTDPTTGNDVNAVQDTVGNDAATFTPVGAVNSTPQAPGPVLQTATVNGSTVTLAYNEALSAIGPTPGAFAVDVAGAVATVTAATVSGQSVVLTLATPVANGQPVTVGYTDPTAGNDVNAVQDTVGNDASSTLTPVAATNITPPPSGPVFQTATVTGSTLTLAYDEALSPVGPNAGSFAVAANGVADAVTGATVSGQTVVLTLATPVANGQAITVGYTDPTAGNDVNAVQDSAGNDAATLSPVAATNATPQAPGPVLQTATADGSTVTLAYDEALSPVGPNAGSFAVTANGVTDAVTGATVSGQTVVLTLATPVANGQAVTVGYTDPSAGNDVSAVQDSAGNDAATATPIAAVNATAPTGDRLRDGRYLPDRPAVRDGRYAHGTDRATTPGRAVPPDRPALPERTARPGRPAPPGPAAQR